MQRYIIGVWAVTLVAAFCAAAYVSHARLRSEAKVSEENSSRADDLNIPLGDFSFTERSGRPVAKADLQGKVWVASFVFTCCTGQCPQVSGTMAQLHHELADEPEFRLVTFTVDPDRDTPAVLRDYAGRFGADAERWLFLTGKREPLYEFIEKGFLLGVRQNEGTERTPGNEVSHSSRLAVVDRRGHIRGYFEGRRTDERGQPIDDLPRLKQKVAELLREPS
jgi:cytochrome oxidase Cu insertion factor (SCO1/SenC/PrrC family)